MRTRRHLARLAAIAAMTPTAALAEPHNLRGLELLLMALLMLMVGKRIRWTRFVLFLGLAFGAWAFVLNVPLGQLLPTLILVALPVPFFLGLDKPAGPVKSE
jgi:hypothetical protein